jgi:endonuclease/exonuclease/phosphatase family metal-dependent hydrolase
MRVLTWNVLWRAEETWLERQHRQRGIVSALDLVRPDVAGLQEVWSTREQTQSQLLADELGLYTAYGAPSLPPPPAPEDPGRASVEIGVAVLSRWPILEVRRHPMPSGHRPEIVSLAVVIDHPHGPLHMVVSCIDWERGFGARRIAQTRTLAGLLTEPYRDGPLPVVLTADLNAPPTTPEIRVLTDVMVDAWEVAGPAEDPGHTLSTENPLAPRAAWQLDERIDYVLARPGKPGNPVVVERVSLVGHPYDGRHPSDHCGVVADLLV